MFNIVRSSILQTHRIIHCIISIPSKSSTLYNNPLPSSGPARMPMSLLMSNARRECWQRTSCVPGATRSPPVGFHRLLTKQDGRYYYLNSQIKELRQSKFFWDLKPQTRHLTHPIRHHRISLTVGIQGPASADHRAGVGHGREPEKLRLPIWMPPSTGWFVALSSHGRRHRYPKGVSARPSALEGRSFGR